MAENETPAAAPASAPDAEPTALQELVEAVASEPPFTWDPMAQAAISVVGDLVSGTGGTPAVGPAGTPLDQPTTPEQQDQMFASDSVESDPLGQALVSGLGDVVLGPIVEGAEFLEKPLEHAAAFVVSEVGLYLGDKAADAARDGGSTDQGTSASEVQAKIDALDATEAEAYQQLNYWKQNVDEFERWMQWYYDQIRQENDYIKVLNEDIARARELQAETGDPDKIFERSMEVDQALIKSAEQGIQMDRDMINALEIQLQAARENLQKADDEILALEDKRQRLIDDLNEAVRQAAIASDQAPKP